jgi:hypothetical protein
MMMMMMMMMMMYIYIYIYIVSMLHISNGQKNISNNKFLKFCVWQNFTYVQKNALPLSSGSSNNPSKQQTELE